VGCIGEQNEMATKLANLAIVAALGFSFTNVHAQDEDKIDTTCQIGPARLNLDIQKYYRCTRNAAIVLESSQATADLIALAANSRCNVVLIDLNMEAESCDFRANPNAASAIPKSNANLVANLKELSYADAILTVLSIRAMRISGHLDFFPVPPPR
jgi:hypothetical protein